MPLEVRGGKEGRRFVADQRLLVGLGRYPEHDDVKVAFASTGVGGIWSGTAKEHERLATHLVYGVVTSSVVDRDMRQAHSQAVHIRDTRPSAPVRHISSVAPPARSTPPPHTDRETTSNVGAVALAPPRKPAPTFRWAHGHLRHGPPSRRGGSLRQPLVKPGTDLLGRQLGPLPLLTGNDDTGCRHTGEAGETENLPDLHKQETFC